MFLKIYICIYKKNNIYKKIIPKSNYGTMYKLYILFVLSHVYNKDFHFFLSGESYTQSLLFTIDRSSFWDSLSLHINL